MGLFKKLTPVEQATRDDQKRIADEARAAAHDDKEAAKLIAMLEKYGLNFDAYSLDALRARNRTNIKAIASQLFGTGFYSAMTFGTNAEKATVGFLGAMVEQNWIIIRQQEQMIRLLEGSRDT